MKKKIYSLIVLIFVSITSIAQLSFKTPENVLDEVARDNKGINEKIRIDVSGLSLYELLNSVAEEHKLNISSDPEMNELVVSNFYDVTVRDVVMFLVDKYNLEISYANKIIVFRRKQKEISKPKEKPKRIIDISYKQSTDFLSVKLKNDSLPSVTEKITELSGKNIVLAPEIKQMKVSAYIINRPFDQVLEMVAKSNELRMSKDENGFYFLQKGEKIVKEPVDTRNNRGSRRRNSTQRKVANDNGDVEIIKKANGYLSVKAFNGNGKDIILECSELLGINYFLYDELDQVTANVVADNIDFDTLLEHLFKGTKFTFKKTNELYFIGEQDSQGLRTTELIQLERRPVESVVQTLPQALVSDVEIHEFPELNGILVSGSKPLIEELKQVIRKLDKIVPLVQIEVIIAQYRKSNEVITGLQGILDKIEGQNQQTGGLILPRTDVTLSSGSINKIIDAFNGLGIINIGKVTKDFYATLSALENNSIIKIESTPKIATLSGHEASVSIGETNYYFEQTNRLINTGANNDNLLQSGQFRPTEANLSVNIKPSVSKDEHITLEIAVEQSSFLGRIAENAPPGRSTQRFESLIRVRNDEMILLGGLDELEKENSGSGTPFLSRIPIIRWFFSSRSRRKDKSKLHVFIKPTLVY